MIKIHQSKIPEKVSSKIVSKIYDIAKENESDNNSDLFGYVQSTYGYQKECTYLKNKFSNFDIDILSEYYKEFVDENCKNFFAVCPAGDGVGITLSSWNRLSFNWGDKNTTYGPINNANYFGTTMDDVNNNTEGSLTYRELLASIEYFPEIIDLNVANRNEIGYEVNGHYFPIFCAMSGLKEINIPRTCNFANFTNIKNNNLEIIDMSNIDYYLSTNITIGGGVQTTPNLKKIILAPPISTITHGGFTQTYQIKEDCTVFLYTKLVYNDPDASTWTYNGLRNATFWVQDSAYEDFLTHIQIKPKLGTNITLKKFSEYTGNDLVQKWIHVSNPMDILYENSNGELFVRSEVVNPSEGLTPIALCIAGTGFFGPNEPARWISLKYMSYETPESGAIPPSIYGTSDMSMQPGVGKDIKNITNYNNKFKNYTGSEEYLSTSYQTQTENLIPSVFDNDNNWNTNELGNKNEYAMTDIDGKTSNKVVIELLETSTIQPNWKTDATISTTISNDTERFYPLVCCCYRYHTVGTYTGNWYLGSLGEVVMILAYRTEINQRFAEINNLYPNDCASLLLNDAKYYSLTEYNSGHHGFYYVIPKVASIGAMFVNANTGIALAMLKY